MNGTQRGDVMVETVNDELRVAYLCHSEMDIAVDMAQMEWVARKVEITSDHHLQILYIILYL